MANESNLYIKNMVCDRCIHTVKADLDQLGLAYGSVQLGRVTLSTPLTDEKKHELQGLLESQGFELLETRNTRTIDTVKTIVLSWVNQEGSRPNKNLSQIISEKINHDYNSISRLFSQVEGVTIEKFLILQKIEKVKELLFYDEQSLSEIAIQLDYSSVHHLSSQFKKVTGMTPSEYKKLQNKPRKPLDKLL